MEQVKNTSITNIIEAGRERQRIVQQIESMIKPILSDIKDIPRLYELFCESSTASKDDIRQQFALAVLYLYSPASLVYGGVPIEIKSLLAKLYGRSIRTIDNITKNIFFLYDHHGGFRMGVDAGVEQIRKQLKTK